MIKPLLDSSTVDWKQASDWHANKSRINHHRPPRFLLFCVLKKCINASAVRGLWKLKKLATCKEFGKFVDCGIRNPGKIVLVVSQILGFGIRNIAQWIRNPTNDWTPESMFQSLESRTWIRNPRHGIQNPRLSWILLLKAKKPDSTQLLNTSNFIGSP